MCQNHKGHQKGHGRSHRGAAPSRSDTRGSRQRHQRRSAPESTPCVGPTRAENSETDSAHSGETRATAATAHPAAAQ